MDSSRDVENQRYLALARAKDLHFMQPQWVEFLVKFFHGTKFELAALRAKLRNQEFLSVTDCTWIETVPEVTS